MIKNPTRCNNVSKFYYSLFIWSSACFGRHPAHHQEPKTALAQFSWQRPPTTRPTTFPIWIRRGCQRSFSLLMMGEVSPKTCWISYKYGIIKFWYIVASCWIFYHEKRNDLCFPFLYRIKHILTLAGYNTEVFLVNTWQYLTLRLLMSYIYIYIYIWSTYSWGF